MEPNENKANQDAASILDELKKRRKENYDYKNDPNYQCRVQTIETKKRLPDGTILTRTKGKILFNDTNSTLLRAMSRVPGYNLSMENGNNNNPRTKKSRNGKIITIRPNRQVVLNGRAMNLIKADMSAALFDSRGKIKPEFTKTLTHRSESYRTFGFNDKTYFHALEWHINNPTDNKIMTIKEYNQMLKEMKKDSDVTKS